MTHLRLAHTKGNPDRNETPRSRNSGREECGSPRIVPAGHDRFPQAGGRPRTLRSARSPLPKFGRCTILRFNEEIPSQALESVPPCPPVTRLPQSSWQVAKRAAWEDETKGF